MIEATGTCAGIENYSRFLSGRKPGEPPQPFLSTPDNAIIFVDESHVTVPQLNGMYKEIILEKKPWQNMVFDFRLVWIIDLLNLRSGT